MKKPLRITIHILSAIALYCAFSFALFLGLQVKPLYGNIALALAVLLLIMYIIWIARDKRR